MGNKKQPGSWRRRVNFFLPADLERRWERPHLKKQLEVNERVVWTDIGATGLLSHPLVRVGGPVGSAFWDIAVTDSRLIAVRYLLIPIRRRKVQSFSFAEATSIEVRFHTVLRCVTLSLTTQELRWKLKMFRMALDYAAAERAICEVCPEAVISGLPGEA